MGNPKLKPLQEWVCDTCRQVIAQPDQGWVEWVRENDRYVGFRICHHQMHSPRGSEEGCYKYGAHDGRGDMHLNDVSGDEGRYLLSFLDMGPIHDPEGKHAGRVDVRSWSELYRRLFIPYYEEARKYFEEAEADGFYEGHNEVLPYVEDTLLGVIREYGP